MVDYGRVCWLIDETLEERQYECGFPLLSEAVTSLGCKVFKTKYQRNSRHPDIQIPFDSDQCVILHGSIQFNNQITSNPYFTTRFTPGSYFNKETKTFSTFATHLGNYILNDDYYLLPYGEFLRRGLKKDTAVFIKPNSGMKEFTGKVITYENFDHETSSMRQIENVSHESLVVIASPKEIEAEFRYFIVDGKVVAKSQYRWDKLDVRSDTMPVCDELAETIAKHSWQADYTYVCDIAYRGAVQAPKVIELNAFSSSGLYAADTNSIAKAVSDMAWKEFTGNI